MIGIYPYEMKHLALLLVVDFTEKTWFASYCCIGSTLERIYFFALKGI